MNVNSLKTALKRIAGVDDGDPLLDWLNAAYHEFEDAFDWPFLEVRSTSITSAVGAGTIVLPSDFFKPVLLKDTTHGYGVEYMPRAEFFHDYTDLTATGRPVNYTLIGLNTIQLWPVLDASVTWDLLYQKQFDDLVNDTDVPLIPTRYHYGLAYGASAIALQAESEEERSQAASAKFNDYIGRAVAKYSSRQLGEPDTVRDSQDYFTDVA